MNRLFVLLCLLLLAAGPAGAETRSASYGLWNVTGGTVRILYTLPDAEAKRLAAPGAPVLTTKQVADYILAHMGVSHRGKACPIVDQGEDLGLINTLALTPGFLRFEMVFQCPDGAGLTLSDTAFADRIANHADYGRVQINNGGLVQHVFTAAAPRFALPAPGGTLQGDSIFRYAQLGFAHVANGVDILCFTLALLLIARRRRDFALAFGALAAGYGTAALLGSFNLAAVRFTDGEAFSGMLVLAAAAAGLALSRPDPRRAALGLSSGALVLGAAAWFFHGAAAAFAVLGIALLAIATLYVPARDERRALFLVLASFLFALLDGFTLAGDVAILFLSPAQLAPMLVGFNAATLAGSLVLPLCAMAAWLLVPLFRRLTVPRGLAAELAASVFIGFGIFGFATWLYS
ncbi:MAG TPA: hypothetical protein VGM72_03085 [Micropepsaceae bacterium]|jgi:hypothetical protein